MKHTKPNVTGWPRRRAPEVSTMLEVGWVGGCLGGGRVRVALLSEVLGAVRWWVEDKSDAQLRVPL